jgi:hypothetical protein
MKTRAIIVLLLSAVLLNTCLSATRLSSNQVEKVDRKIEKVFVLIENPGDLRFFKHFQKDFLLELLDVRVPTRIFDKTLITMETDEEIASEIAAYGPSHLIRISPKSNRTAWVDFADSGFADEVRTGGRYYIEITQTDSQQVIWKGLLSTDEYLSLRTAAAKSARKIVADLKQRDLIAP